ncbi:Nif11-like leader peptide family natural product precursor [filamentous cyanobacterium LEGE 11480]|uniref:Nif11-like leader peptide family natural product n=1 Tax=Romeriopsis navalis LEGE 11480 TaxID=2777977 RepID=A0A928VJS1_9CYAN|nr:Nif11-like leader peptide family natural product precursor [Romeriopsis navalis]MBE9029871.1 Nif11-like leader peptide family natural product precursor [Romeriopsis navalis LEGE 11480]
MSAKSAERFLCAVSQDQWLRDRFNEIESPDEFVRLSHQLGYCFTAAELKTIISEQSQGVILRRHTGVWKWLRDVQWM